MELYRLQIEGYGEGLVKLNTQKKKKWGWIKKVSEEKRFMKIKGDIMHSS